MRWRQMTYLMPRELALEMAYWATWSPWAWALPVAMPPPVVTMKSQAWPVAWSWGSPVLRTQPMVGKGPNSRSMTFLSLSMRRVTPPIPVLGDSGLYFLSRAWFLVLSLRMSWISCLTDGILASAGVRAAGWYLTCFSVCSTFGAWCWGWWLTRLALLRRSEESVEDRKVTVGSSRFIM